MRRIGTLSSEQQARKFSDYLYTLKIETQVDGRNGEWDIWVLDEDRMDQGRNELAAFRASPDDRRYADAARLAQQQRDAQLQEVMSSVKQQVDLRERWERPLWQQIPVTFGLLGLSLLASLVSQFGDNAEVLSALQVQATRVLPGSDVLVTSSRTLHDVRRGEVWRLVTPIFPHLSLMHLLFNGMLVFVLGGMIERERGSWKMLLFLLVIAVISNLAQYLAAGPRFAGLSGVGYGLFGYVWLGGRLEPNSGLQISRQSVFLLLLWLILCTTGAFGPIANWCHFVGLAVGMALAGGGFLLRRARA